MITDEQLIHYRNGNKPAEVKEIDLQNQINHIAMRLEAVENEMRKR